MRVFRFSFVLLLLDQLSKLAAERFLPESVPVIPHVFHLTVVHNQGGAFGLLAGQSTLFLAVGIVTVLVIFILRRAIQAASRRVRWAAALILAGAAGNSIDRLRLGYVIDFLDFRVWPVFNVADSCITVGMLILIWSLFNRDVARPV